MRWLERTRHPYGDCKHADNSKWHCDHEDPKRPCRTRNVRRRHRLCAFEMKRKLVWIRIRPEIDARNFARLVAILGLH